MENLSILTLDEVITRFRQLTDGLYYQSESDYPIEVVQFNLIKQESITKENVLTLIGSSSIMPIEEAPPAFFFRNLVKPESVTENGNDAKNQVVALQLICEQQLQNPQVFRIGKRTITLLLLGKTVEGVLAGLKTTVVET